MIWDNIAEMMATDEDGARGAALAGEYRERGYLARTPREMLKMSDGVIAAFYAALAGGSEPGSPVSGRPDSSWMRDRDFCFFNIRATGTGEEFGNWITAAKLLPVVRADAIHVGPFTRYDFHCIYAVQCTHSVAPETVHDGLAAAGVEDAEQVRAFVQAAHLLGKTAGFDLEPHVTQFAIDVLMRPELFRWIRISEDRSGLADGMDMEAMLVPDVQIGIHKKVRDLVGTELAAAGLATIDPEDGDTEAVRRGKIDLYYRLIGRAIEEGLWTIPSHTWAGAGLPRFVRYNREGNYPEFLYLTADGRDQSAEALAVVTPFRFFDNIPVNRMPDEDDLPRPVPEAVDRFTGIALRWVNGFGFDFIRYDSADHIFDSTAFGDRARPASDRPTPAVLEACVRRSREEGAPHIGNFAERMGNELEEYASVGFDLILGSDMFDRLDRAHLERVFEIQALLEQREAAGAYPASIVFSIDTHDTGNPFIHGQPLITLEGPDGMLVRQFVSRFGTWGRARRPKYEVMGAQDLSHGLYRANVSDENLEWVGDGVFNRRYHWLEDVYGRFRPFLDGARLMRRHIDDRLAWWVLGNGEDVLVAVLSLFQGAGGGSLHDIRIPDTDGREREWTEYDFKDCREERVAGPSLAELPYRGFRLFQGK